MKWGITNPTHPIWPLTLTHALVIKVDENITIFLSKFVLIPRLIASSSLRVNKFYFHLSATIGIIPIIMGIIIKFMSLILIDARDPINQ